MNMNEIDQLVQKNNYDVISSDIFDTLVYRLTATPKDIFSIVATQAKLVFEDKFYYKPEDYQLIREAAEREARRNSISKEIRYKDIFNYLPFSEEINLFLQEEEFKQELSNMVLNHEVYHFLLKHKEEGKSLILVSDMYFSHEQICQLLKHLNVDLTLFNKIYVSSEYNKSKSSGKLFIYIKEEFKNQHIFHIGDNYFADNISAKKMGVNAAYYEPIIESILSTFRMEEIYTKKPLNELRSIRKLIASATTYQNQECAAYKIGAQVLGPVYTLFIEWVIKQAQNFNIKVICPLMREGELYGQLLQQQISEYNLPIEVKPLYVSRKATFLAGLEKYDKKVLLSLLDRQLLKLNDLFNILLVPIENTIYEQYKDKIIRETKEIQMESSTLFESILQFLLSEDVTIIVNNNIEEQKKYLIKYIEQVTDNEAFITVDLGGNATIQCQIDLALQNTRNIHLLLVSKNTAVKKIVKGHRLLSWLGFDYNTNYQLAILFRSIDVIEALTNTASGSTIYYENKENQIIPILSSITYPAEHTKLQKICWEGINDFQHHWMKIDKIYNLKSSLLTNVDGILAILTRFIQMPTNEEANVVKHFIHDEQMYYSTIRSLIDKEHIEKLQEKGIEEFLDFSLHGYSENLIYWPQGVVALKYPTYFLKKFFKEYQYDKHYLDMYTVIENVIISRYKKIVIYGAGEIGQKLFTICKLFKLDVDCFIDRNYEVLPDGTYDIPVRGLSYLDHSIDLIIIASKAFYNEIRQDIIKHYGEKSIPTIVGI